MTELVKRKQLNGEQRAGLIKDLALGNETQRSLGEKYGISQQAVGVFNKVHAREIERCQEEMTGMEVKLWMVDLEERIRAYQEIYDDAYKNTEGHLKVRLQALKQMDELSGQIPPRTSIAIIPVQHMVVDSEGNNLIDVL